MYKHYETSYPDLLIQYKFHDIHHCNNVHYFVHIYNDIMLLQQHNFVELVIIKYVE